MDYAWDRIIGSIVYKRVRAASRLGVTLEDLMSIGRMSALEAESSWDPEGGRTMSSWIYLQVNWDIARTLERAGREMFFELPDTDAEYDALDAAMLIRESLDYLKAHLSDPDWSILWLRHAEGRSPAELVKMLNSSSRAIEKRLERAKNRAVGILTAHAIVEIGAS